MFFTVVIIAIFFLLLLLRIQFPPNYLAMRKLNGPPTIPLLGNSNELLTYDLYKITEKLLEWTRRYPSPVRIKLGHIYWVMLTKASHFEVLMKSNTNITKSGEYDAIEPWLHTGLLMSTGSKWHRRRKQLTPAFHFQILKDFVPIMNEQALVFSEILQDAADTGKPFNAVNPVTALSLDIICETAFGKQLHSQTQYSEYAQAVFQFSELGFHRAVTPWLRPDWIFNHTSSGKEYYRALKILQNFTVEVTKEREAAFMDGLMDSGGHNVAMKGEFPTKRRLAFLDLLLDMKKSGQIDDEGIAEEVDTFMFEGHDTTSSGMAWSLYCIARHADVQDRLHEEIDEMFNGLSNDMVQADDVSKLQYLDCVLKEVMRLYPPVPLIGRRIEQDFEIDGLRIPKGASVLMNAMALHRDPEAFPDPMRFDPSRFDPENAEGRHPFAYVPFSAGPRNCIGQKFATLELKISICHVLHRFRLEAMEEQRDMKPTMQLILKPTNGVWLKIIPR